MPDAPRTVVEQLNQSSFGKFIKALEGLEDIIPPGTFSLPRVVVSLW